MVLVGAAEATSDGLGRGKRASPHAGRDGEGLAREARRFNKFKP